MLVSQGLRAAVGAPQFWSYSETQNTGTGVSVSVALPYGVQEGDLLVALILGGTNTLTYTGPAGWTEFRDNFSRGWYHKTATATETGPYTFAASANTNTLLGTILVFRGYAYSLSGANSAGASNPIIAGVTVPSDNAIVLAVVTASTAASTSVQYTFPAGWTDIYANDDGILPSQAVGLRYFNAGATGSVTVNGTAGISSSGTLVCLTRS